MKKKLFGVAKEDDKLEKKVLAEVLVEDPKDAVNIISKNTVETKESNVRAKRRD